MQCRVTADVDSAVDSKSRITIKAEAKGHYLWVQKPTTGKRGFPSDAIWVHHQNHENAIKRHDHGAPSAAHASSHRYTDVQEPYDDGCSMDPSIWDLLLNQ
jgi:hypothetical protein